MSDVLTPQQRYRRILERHLPPDRVAELADGSRVAASAVGWVYDFLERHRVHFHITRERRSKLGDYRRPSPDKPIYVNVGDEISKGKVLCVIEAMKLFNEIEAEVSGKIAKILVEDGSPVEYDQPLFLIEP